MKVIVPFPYYYPEQCAGLNIIDDILRRCAKENIESLLYVPWPNRNVMKDYIWHRDDQYESGLFKIHRFKMYKEGKNPLFRALRYLLNEIIYTYALLFKDYDLIFLDSTPPIQGLKIPLVKFFRRKLVLHNAQDIFPDSLVGAGLAKKYGLLWKIGCLVSNITYRYSDKIIVISNDFKQTLISKGVPSEKIEVVYNWVDEKKIIPIQKDTNPFYSQFNLDKKKFRLVYAGNLGNAQNIELIIKAAEQLKDHRDIEFVIFGSGGLESEIRREINILELENVKVFPIQSPDKVSYVYGLGDVCLVCCKPGFGGSAMPSKTWSILSAGRPVLASFDDGELKEILEKNQMGIFTKAGDVQNLASTILELANRPSECHEMGKRGRMFIEGNLTKDTNTLKYVEAISNLIKTHQNN